MTSSPIRSVVLDIGGVLVASPLGEFSKLDTEHGLMPGTAMSLLRGGSRFAECETGRISFAEFCSLAVADVRAEQGIAVPPERVGSMMAAIVGGAIDEGMHSLVLELKAAGLQIGLCSNIHAEVDGWIRSMFPAGTIDVYCLSYEVGQRKPEPGMFEELRDRCGFPAEEIVFVDDFEENVIGASGLGIRAIPFAGADVLRAQLREFGVDLAAL